MDSDALSMLHYLHFYGVNLPQSGRLTLAINAGLKVDNVLQILRVAKAMTHGGEELVMSCY